MIDVSAFEESLDGRPERGVSIAAFDSDEVWDAFIGGADQRPFAIGSISKVVTALGLSLASLAGEVSPSTALGSVVTELQDRNPPVARISLEQLASHASGLPREAPSLVGRYERGELDERNPYEGLGEDDLIEALIAVSPAEPPGTYSNLAFQALALALRRATEMSYSEMLRLRICDPLRLRMVWHADIAPDSLAQGYDEAGTPAPRWTEVLPGPGGVWSTATDLAALLREATTRDGPLSSAIAVTMAERVRFSAARAVGLGWLIAGDDDSGWRWHNGASGGFHSFAAVSVGLGRGLVALANWAAPASPVERAAKALLGIAP